MSSTQSNPEDHPLGALRIPYVRAFAVGRMTATMGAQFVSVAVGWELWERTGDPFALGLVGLVQVAPAMMLMLPAGNAADRFARRHVAMLAHALLAVAALGLAAVSWLAAPVEIVYALLALSGVGRAFSAPSTGTILAQLLKPREFANAYAWLVSSGQFASISGPALGGFLIAGTNAAAPSYVAAALFHLLFIAAMATMPLVPPQPGAGRNVREVFAGIGFIRRSPVYLAAISLDLFAVLLGGAVALLPIFAKDVLDVGAGGLGLLRSAPAVGALLAGLLMTRLPPWQRPGRVLLVAVAGFGAATVGFGLSRDMALSLACLFFVGAFDSVSMVIRGTLQQVITPDHLRGRVAAVSSLFIGLSNEMGAFRAGSFAAIFGSAVFAVVSGGVGTLLVVALVPLIWPTLARIGPLHTLQPQNPRDDEAESERAADPARA